MKELLQNADDASARVVKFVYDKRAYSTKTIFNEALGLFHGPGRSLTSDFMIMVLILFASTVHIQQRSI